MDLYNTAYEVGETKSPHRARRTGKKSSISGKKNLYSKECADLNAAAAKARSPPFVLDVTHGPKPPFEYLLEGWHTTLRQPSVFENVELKKPSSAGTAPLVFKSNFEGREGDGIRE